VRPTPLSAAVLAALGIVTWFALLIAGFGFLSLLLDADVVPEADAGPVFGTIIVLVAGAVLYLLLRRWLRALPSPSTAFSAAALAVWGTELVVGTVGYTLITARVGELVAYPIRHAISPFTLTGAALAGVVAVMVLALRRSGGSVDSPARWPWENDDEP
jgi:hypothetical protein